MTRRAYDNPSGCPVLFPAREAQSLAFEISDADEEREHDTGRSLQERLNELRKAISYLHPKSLAGVIFQLELIGVYADEMSDNRDSAKRNALCFSIQRMTEGIEKFLNDRHAIRRAA